MQALGPFGQYASVHPSGLAEGVRELRLLFTIQSQKGGNLRRRQQQPRQFLRLL